MSETPGLVLAFAMGMVTFLTPCLLPLVPAYISFISGHSLAEIRSAEKSEKVTRSVMVPAIFFVLGFSIIFLILGATAGALGQALVKLGPILIRVGGALVIFFGLQLIGVFKLMPLLKEKRYQGEIRATGPVKAFLFGLAFAFGWSPCIGPILASILVVAANQDTMLKGILLLLAYSLGMAVPFLLTAALIEQFFGFFERIKPHFRKIEISAGAILILVGILMVFDRYRWLKYYLEQILPESLRRMG